MSYARLYDEVQTHTGRVSTTWLKERAIALSSITSVREQWSSVIDESNLRGFYVEGPMGPPVPLSEKQALIVLSRGMCTGTLGPHWRRLIFTKELMHVFDRDDEKASSPELLDKQIERFADPTAEMSAQYRAETKAMWRALAALCPESNRLAYIKELEAGDKSVDIIASELHLPSQYARNLFRNEFTDILKHILRD